MAGLLNFALIVAPILIVASALPPIGPQPRASCTVTSYSEVADAVVNCNDIVIDGITVPGGETLKLHLQQGSRLTFKGTTKFGYKEWTGPLVEIQGDGIFVEGASGHRLDGQGPLWWDGLGGGGGVTKPKFMKIRGTGGSQVVNINILNCPTNCISIGNSHDLTISGWNIDNSAGDTGGGHNTDGFDMSSSSNVVIKDSVVKNQDDCVAINQGSNYTIQGLYCSGSHGLSLSVGFSASSVDANTVSNVLFYNCTVVDSDNGIHVKTHPDAGPGAIRDVIYQDIIVSGIRKYGISIQEDYGDTGHPKPNVPITDLQMINVKGTLSGSKAYPVYIVCADNGCADWNWSGVSLSGGGMSQCNFTPNGYTC